MDNLAILLSETLPATFPITFEIEIAFMDARMTIKELAQLSGVGISTVSRVLNKRPDVNEETRERVMEIIRREGYAPNTNAKHLKQLSSECVAVIVRGRKNLFFSGLLEKLQSGIERAGLQFLPYYIDENDDEILAAQRVYAERKVRGVIFLGGCHAECDELLRLLPVPCVFSTVSAAACRAENVSSVSVDDRQGARRAVDYLFDHGHTEILILGGETSEWNTARLRYEGVCDSFLSHGRTLTPDRYLVSTFSFASAYEAVRDYAGAPYTAVFAMSDTMAIGAARALGDLGLCVPEDVSIIGYDGIELASYYEPVLATMRQPQETLAEKSVELLLSGMERPGRHILLETELIGGMSVVQPRA